MAYTISQIIGWAKPAQPLARIGEAKRRANGDKAADLDLDMKIYITRKDCEYAYAQNADAAIQFIMGNYLLMLMGIYLFPAQAATGGGGSISPITPGTAPDPYDFEVGASSFIVTGASSKQFPVEWTGYNILFVRGSSTQSTVNQGTPYYSWNKTTRLFTLLGTSSAAVAGEVFQIYPIV